MTSTWSGTFRFAATRVFPIGFVIGAAMETFMCYTGFYAVATRKEAERRMERAENEALRLGRGAEAAAPARSRTDGPTGGQR
jgi:hypothetical protein